MPCYHPLHGYVSTRPNPKTGKHSWVPSLRKAGSLLAEHLAIPCGRCIGCRLERSRQWALRCVHENQLHEESAFVTLTYDDAHLPPGGTLKKKDFQDFAKRLRKRFHGRKIKYLHCGEYGGRSRRPHYHALLFGIDFDDKKPFSQSADGSPIFTSEILQRLWPSGFCTTGAVTFESAAYVARYVVEKINGKAADELKRRTPNSLLLRHYEQITPEGEIVRLLPEYITMSLKGNKPGEPGGIAAGWYKQFKSDVYPYDEVVIRGRAMKPPKFYDRLLELEDPALRELIKERRQAAALLRQGDSTTARLKVREKVKLAQITNLKRTIE